MAVMVEYGKRQSDKISTQWTGETLLKTPLIISVALENSHDEGGEEEEEEEEEEEKKEEEKKSTN
ncbi:hypothetical protein E2C01_085193 [Portunus trituberculatus]|uniref:Uncharacterized protein n=1 Tax=Portunus trituberculatus TaxID=210409 RepID=A0A5B7J643_PORTR|nr:hypothetical protein [Portunus trituberculatus]